MRNKDIIVCSTFRKLKIKMNFKRLEEFKIDYLLCVNFLKKLHVLKLLNKFKNYKS